MLDWEAEIPESDEEPGESEVELECVECGELGYPLEGQTERPYMCFKCKLNWN